MSNHSTLNVPAKGLQQRGEKNGVLGLRQGFESV
jgi:hypothetical protein